jgi:hypothetical protein
VSNERSWSRNKIFVTYILVEILGDISAPWFASMLATLIQLCWVMALLGSAATLRCPFVVPYMLVKMYNLCRV